VRAVLPLILALCVGCSQNPDPQPTPNPTSVPSPTPDPTPTPGPRIGFDCGEQTEHHGLVKVANAIAGQYIVRYKSNPRVRSHVEGVTSVRDLSSGYAARIATAALAKILSDPNVAYVQEDGVKRVPETTASVGTANVESWGLDRIDQRPTVLDDSFTPDGDGAGVNIAIVDTGITPNPDFEDRLSSECFSAYGSCKDGHGHGTHVSGTAAGKRFGVAKKATLYASRVLDANGSGSDSNVIRGIEWVTAKKLSDRSKDWVLNMSLGGGDSPALNQATCDAIAAGVVVVAAAGNESADADTSSPGRVRQAITVGASTSQDFQADFSNYGSLLDLYAPGVDITSDQPDGSIATWSGTSMATPHVTGAAALYLGKHPRSTPREVADALQANATTGHMQDVSAGGPDLILFVGLVN